jgi:ABC-type sugar transport system substrate-binding protein
MRNAWAAAVLAAAAVVASGCGGSGGGTGAAAAGGAKVPAYAKDFKPPASGCGSYPAKAPADPDGVIAGLDEAHQAALGGYADFPGSTIKVLKSRWAGWKPSHPGPYTVAVSWGQLISDFQVQMVDHLKADLAKTKGVGDVVVRTTGSNLDVAQQLQQYNGLVQQKPDVIVLETPSPDSFNGPVQKAAEQGIPTVTILSPVPVDGAVNVDNNNYLAAAEGASYLTKVLGGKGKVLTVRALATTSVDNQVDTAWKRVVGSCPGMEIAGEAFGAFSEAAAKSETLKFLGTHPAKLDGVTMMPGEAVGVLQAFKQTGRPIPPAAEVGMDKGFFGYWNQNQAGGYHASSTSMPPVPAARAVAEVAGRMLAGQGVKLNTLVGKIPVVNDATLADWVDPSWTLTTPGTVPGEPDDFLPSKELDGFFTKPAPLE